MRSGIIVGVLGVLLGGCAYQAETVSTPATNVVTSYSNKVPGKWLVYVDAERFRDSARVIGVMCSAHTFPVDLSTGFPASVRGTLANVIQDIETVNAPTPSDQAGGRAARGTITIRAESAKAQIRAIERFWSADMAAEVEISAAVMVDGRNGRLFGKTIDGRGRSERPAGFACAGGAEALKVAAEDAQRDLLRRIAEEIANADRIRAASR